MVIYRERDRAGVAVRVELLTTEKAFPGKDSQ